MHGWLTALRGASLDRTQCLTATYSYEHLTDGYCQQSTLCSHVYSSTYPIMSIHIRAQRYMTLQDVSSLCPCDRHRVAYIREPTDWSGIPKVSTVSRKPLSIPTTSKTFQEDSLSPTRLRQTITHTVQYHDFLYIWIITTGILIDTLVLWVCCWHLLYTWHLRYLIIDMSYPHFTLSLH